MKQHLTGRAPKRKRQSRHENETQTRILNTLRRIPWVHVERNNTGRLPDRFGRWVTYGLGSGSADVICFIGPLGRVLAIEVKSPGKKLTTEQEMWHAAVREVGVETVMVTTLDEALAAVEHVRNESLLTAYARTKSPLHAIDSLVVASEIQTAKESALAVEDALTARRTRTLKMEEGETRPKKRKRRRKLKMESTPDVTKTDALF